MSDWRHCENTGDYQAPNEPARAWECGWSGLADDLTIDTRDGESVWVWTCPRCDLEHVEAVVWADYAVVMARCVDRCHPTVVLGVFTHREAALGWREHHATFTATTPCRGPLEVVELPEEPRIS